MGKMHNLLLSGMSALLLFVVVCTLCACAVTPDEPKDKEFKIEYFEVIYLAAAGGQIRGETTQRIAKGDDAETVVAVPNIGHTFIKWSDGLTSSARSDTNITADAYLEAEFERRSFSVIYSAGIGGRIDGGSEQNVAYGDTSLMVTAIPNDGYEFVKWSDGITVADRADKNVIASIRVNAEFRRITKAFTLCYNEATANSEIERVTLRRNELSDTALSIPIRDNFTFGGWYLDWLFSTLVSDEFGKVVIGEEIFDTETDCLYAKWTAVSEVKYKILLIFVTEIYATLTTVDGTEIEVDYTMSGTERLVCEKLGPLLEHYLNAMLNGLVIFEVDMYFTKAPLDEKHFYQGTASVPGGDKVYYDYGINAYDIEEVFGMLASYGSVIASFNMNDYSELLHITGGSAGKKYGEIHMETVFGGLVRNNDPIEWLFDSSIPGVNESWEFFMELYLHELTHTFEMMQEFLMPSQDVIGYHAVRSCYATAVDFWFSEIEVIRLFLLNQAEVNGEKVGIRYEFWRDYVYGYYGPQKP